MLDRLKGRPFSPGRQATREIQVDTFPWQYKNMDDKIEVEVWDVVDTVLRDDDAPAGQWASTLLNHVCISAHTAFVLQPTPPSQAH